MEKRWWRFFPWILLVVDLLLACGYTYFSLRHGPGYFDWSVLSYAVVPGIAALIITRQPKNPVGWALLGLGFINLSGNFFSEYAISTVVIRPGSLPFGGFAAWAGNMWWMIGWPLAMVVILLFPNGRPPTRRWWWVLGVECAILLPIFVMISVLSMKYPAVKLLQSDPRVVFTPADWQIFSILAFYIWEPAYVLGMVLAVIGLAVRFARSRGIERKQITWILLAMVVVPPNIVASMLGIAQMNPLLAVVADILNVASVLGFPVAMAFAITRYHLYDIDVIIRRTLLYGTLTITLAMLYYGSVIALQALIARVSGVESPAAIVVSTLLIVVLFSPLRARFQRIIDRRFYRRKYNVDQILESFSAGMRVEVNLDAINNRLIGVVEESLQPESVMLWLVKR